MTKIQKRIWILLLILIGLFNIVILGSLMIYDITNGRIDFRKF